MAFVNTLHHDHKTLFNVGSVGNPLDIPQASYAILTGERDGTVQAPFNVELVRLPYDIEAVVQAARDRDMPHFDVWEIEIRTAIHRSRQGKD